MGKILITLLVLAFMAVCESRIHTEEKNLYAGAKARQHKETARSKTCMKEIGCFYSGKKWDPVWVANKMNWLPDSRDDIGTEFRFYAPGKKVQVIKSQEFTVPEGLGPNSNFKFIIHGYKGGNAEWAKKMKDAFQQRLHCNVIIVDWSNGAEGVDYDGPAVNTQVVGAETGLFIERLVNAKHIDLLRVHLLGHSLGSHVAGYAGKWVKDKLHRKVGRITGMDPAGPNFRNNPPNMRLDMGDAEFVDVIHTNIADYAGSGFGLPKAVGHFDFYPNGGEDQPGCKPAFAAAVQEASNFISNIFKKNKVADPNKPSPIACSHSRAYELVIASLREESCGFNARICSSWDTYKSGKCDKNESVRMGFNAYKQKKLINPKNPIKLYLSTSEVDPYCLDWKDRKG